MQTESLIEGESPRIDVRVRFLQLISREVGRACPGESEKYEVVPVLEVEGAIHQCWEEAVEREIVATDLDLSKLGMAPKIVRWSSPAEERSEILRNADGQVAGVEIRHQRAIDAVVTIGAQTLNAGLWRIHIEVHNFTPLALEASRSEAQQSALTSAHVLLAAHSGQFVSLLEPAEEFASFAADCKNVGAWPVLVGGAGERDLMLASPIILYDYPQVAPESDGDYFDGTEMDEMLALRVMTLTDEEKRAMRGIDRRAREILERTEILSQSSLMHLHGTIRDLKEVPRL